MNIELSKESEQLLQSVLASGESQDVGAHVESLIREDSLTRQQLHAALTNAADSIEEEAIIGLQSGEPLDVTADYWQEKRARIEGQK
ncbi:MAG: hypothetical protein R3C28_07820 [Pirellulaceae bacterium]